MPHTLLAVGALALMALLAFQHQRARVHEQERVIQAHILAAGRSVGDEVFERLDTLPFDAVSTGETTALTPETSFGSSDASDPLGSASDVDDVHGAWAQPMLRVLTDPATGEPRTLSFGVEADVAYVSLQDGTVERTGGTRTFAKEVLLTVRHDHLDSPITLRRIYTP